VGLSNGIGAEGGLISDHCCKLRVPGQGPTICRHVSVREGKERSLL